ncbi:antiterminator Q family protein [Psychrobacter glacincola]|uniref:antiterminator Q family protein n=1 Tax=Psychrobacter glacincola TaxID=56810 RepID=UPI0039AF8176
MSDTVELLKAWGQWSRDNHNLGCKSPSLMLMRSAPHKDKSDAPTKVAQLTYISDDDALRVDDAVADLKSNSERLDALVGYYCDNKDMSFLSKAMRHRVIKNTYIGNMSLDDVARDINYFLGKPLFSPVRVTRVLESAIGFIDGRLVD